MYRGRVGARYEVRVTGRAPTYVLGLNAYHGDASAALIRDGQLIAAVEEERVRRVKHWAGFPAESIGRVLALAGISGADVAHVAVSRNPRAHLARKVYYALRHRPDTAPGLGSTAERTEGVGSHGARSPRR